MLLAQQTDLLTGGVSRRQAAVQNVDQSQTAQVQVLAAEAAQCLTKHQQHVSLERELVQLRVLVTDLSQAPAALTQRVQGIERVVAVLHANLAAARQWTLTLREDVGT